MTVAGLGIFFITIYRVPVFLLCEPTSFCYDDCSDGFPGFSFQVGLPNVGKSTLFNTLTKLAIPAENFPFCTIEPNEARVNIPDERFEWLCKLFKPKSEVCDTLIVVSTVTSLSLWHQ